MPRLFSVVAVLGLLLAVAGDARAQSQTTTGAVQGRVVDAASAPMPGAVVTVREVRTGSERTARADGHGAFAMRLLPVGRYDVEARVGDHVARPDPVSVRVGEVVRLTLVVAGDPEGVLAIDPDGE